MEEAEAKGGKKLVVRKGSGNLAAAIGLYKSGQDIEKLVVVKRIADALTRELKMEALSGSNSPDRMSPIRKLSKNLLTPVRKLTGGVSPSSPTRLQNKLSFVIPEKSR